MATFGLLKDGTLGTLDKDPLDDLNKDLFKNIKVREDSIPVYLDPLDVKKYYAQPFPSEYPQDNFAKIDWLRFTATGFDSLGLINELDHLLSFGSDFKLIDAGKGRLGYTDSYHIAYSTDSGYAPVGVIAFSPSEDQPNCGFMVDITGDGCHLLREAGLFLEVVTFVRDYRLRIARLDLALDLIGSSYTVPGILRDHKVNGLFNSYKSGGKQMSCSSAGDWTDFIVGDLSIDDYDVQEDCPKGLTAYFGSRKSPHYFRVYEKGKQILGELPEHDPTIPKNWVRIEHEWKYDHNHPPIPYEALIRPDFYFLAGRSARSFLTYCYNNISEQPPAEVKAKSQSLQKRLMLTRKIKWAKHQYGRLIKTLRDLGMTAQQVVHSLERGNGLDHYIYDMGPSSNKTAYDGIVM